MDDLQNEVLELLTGATGSTAEALDPLLERHSQDSDFYSRLLLAIVHVRLDEADAKSHFESMVAHHDRMQDSLGRSVDFRVSAMDYLIYRPDIVRMPGIFDLDAYQEIERRATTDQLTGLYNRRFLQTYLDKELNRAKRYDQEFSIIFLDVDDFKRINDTHGHTVGDKVLARVGREITDLLRSEDMAARYGGEEFMIVLPQTQAAGAEVFTERLRAELRNGHSETHITVRFSAGIASYPLHGTTAAELIASADAALYQGKLEGKDRVVVSRVEKRRSKRYRTDMPVLCYADNDELGTVQVFDISDKGIALYAHRLLQPGQLLRLRIGEVPGEPQYEVVTQVVWSQELSDQHTYKLGARWAGADDEAIEALIRAATVA